MYNSPARFHPDKTQNLLLKQTREVKYVLLCILLPACSYVRNQCRLRENRIYHSFFPDPYLEVHLTTSLTSYSLSTFHFPFFVITLDLCLTLYCFHVVFLTGKLFCLLISLWNFELASIREKVLYTFDDDDDDNDGCFSLKLTKRVLNKWMVYYRILVFTGRNKKHPFALEIQHRGPIPTSIGLQPVAELEANDSLVCLCPRWLRCVLIFFSYEWLRLS